MTRFQPPRCPYPPCPSRLGHAPFTWHRKGSYPRKADGRRAQRFRCLACGRRFSAQRFRLDFRLHRPQLTSRIFELLVSKTTMRQIARLLGCRRPVVAHRLRLLAGHCRAFHRQRLARVRALGGLRGSFQLDELETFETDRRLQPVTVPVLIERHSYFVLHLETAPLAARGRLSPAKRRKKEELERRRGRRRSGSRPAVRSSFEVLRSTLAADARLDLQTDRKATYPALVHQLFLGRLAAHVRESSKRARDYRNVLFPINHTLAMMRDGVSRLVRRSWAAAKRRARLEDHLWLWLAYRNYLRGVTNEAPRVTPAMALGVAERRWTTADFLRWRPAD